VSVSWGRAPIPLPVYKRGSDSPRAILLLTDLSPAIRIQNTNSRIPRCSSYDLRRSASAIPETNYLRTAGSSVPYAAGMFSRQATFRPARINGAVLRKGAQCF